MHEHKYLYRKMLFISGLSSMQYSREIFAPLLFWALLCCEYVRSGQFLASILGNVTKRESKLGRECNISIGHFNRIKVQYPPPFKLFRSINWTTLNLFHSINRRSNIKWQPTYESKVWMSDEKLSKWVKNKSFIAQFLDTEFQFRGKLLLLHKRFVSLFSETRVHSKSIRLIWNV